MEVIKVKVGRYLKPIQLIYKGDRIFLKFKYNKKLIEEVRSFDGPKWHGYDEPPRKIWSIKNSPRNLFQLQYLDVNSPDPYAHYDRPLVDYTPRRTLYSHQVKLLRHAITYCHCIFAAEMGLGKTLVAIELMEYVKDKFGLANHEAWYIGPRSGIRAVNLELSKWRSEVLPEMYTYEKLKNILSNWTDGAPPPKVVIYDESSKIKTPTAQRSQASMHLANAVREHWGYEGFIIEMSGTPAPKSPVDWWHQCEVACPGFIKEGNANKFKARLCLSEMRESMSGGQYPHIITWLDDENKCAICGQREHEGNHDELFGVEGVHKFENSKNEVNFLYKRMGGLVLVQFKKDCLKDLPEKRYEVIKVKTTPSILRAAKMIQKTSKRAIEALTLLRELSDGFQYTEKAVGKVTCGYCNGNKVTKVMVPKEEYNAENPTPIKEISADDFEEKELICDNCGGSGEVTKYERDITEISSPKDAEFIDLLDLHDDVGRFIVWGGFTGTIDRLCNIAQRHGWAVLRVDGRGYLATDAMGEQADDNEYLKAMDASHPDKRDLLHKIPKLCFVGHPQAGGMALTLTASPTELFYSNSFSGEARMQAEDRFHRPGADENRGCTIIDLIHLPSDQIVLDNLKKKKKLQTLSMTELAEALDET